MLGASNLSRPGTQEVLDRHEREVAAQQKPTPTYVIESIGKHEKRVVFTYPDGSKYAYSGERR